jgi:hypothetical protein
LIGERKLHQIKNFNDRPVGKKDDHSSRDQEPGIFQQVRSFSSYELVDPVDSQEYQDKRRDNSEKGIGNMQRMKNQVIQYPYRANKDEQKPEPIPMSPEATPVVKQLAVK